MATRDVPADGWTGRGGPARGTATEARRTPGAAGFPVRRVWARLDTLPVPGPRRVRAGRALRRESGAVSSLETEYPQVGLQFNWPSAGYHKKQCFVKKPQYVMSVQYGSAFQLLGGKRVFACTTELMP